MLSLGDLLIGFARGFAALAALWAACSCALAEPGGRRVALIVGNAAYQSLPRLVNAVNDAGAVRDTLRGAGFETFYGSDLKRIDAEALIQRFFRASEGADLVVIYYSGHGVQVAGDNFIVPSTPNCRRPTTSSSRR